MGQWLGSRSTNLIAGAGGLDGRKLNAADLIGLREPRTAKPHTIGPSIIPKYSRFPTVRVVAGGEFDLLTAISESSFLNDGFTVTKDSNRMGYRLSGPPLHLLHKKEWSLPPYIRNDTATSDGQLIA